MGDNGMPPAGRWALCIGGADCVWDDVLAWEALYGQQWDGLVIAANDVGAHWPRRLDHWVSLHANKFARWREVRNKQQIPDDTYTLWAQRSRRDILEHGVQRTVVPWPGGSSGMLAVQVAKEIGCTRAVLCGIPMTATGHFTETTEQFPKQWHAAPGHWKAWLRYHDKMAGWVRSMSGRTRELLGAPSVDWIHGDELR